MNEHKQQSKKTYKNGLVLSGGAYRGVGQLGALKALVERGIKPDAICGTSSGAVNAVLFAHGYSPDEIFGLWQKESIGKVLNFHLPRFGFLKNAEIGKLIAPYLTYERLEELPLPVMLTAACLNTGEQLIFREGRLLQLLEAACAVPGVFEPVEVAGRQCVDGGLVSNLPIEPLEGQCERLIGISVNPVPEKKKLDGLKDLLYRTIWIGLESTVQKNSKLCDWYIEPKEMGEHGFMERSALDTFFNAAYEFTSRFLDEKDIKGKELA